MKMYRCKKSGKNCLRRCHYLERKDIKYKECPYIETIDIELEHYGKMSLIHQKRRNCE